MDTSELIIYSELIRESTEHIQFGEDSAASAVDSAPEVLAPKLLLVAVSIDLKKSVVSGLQLS